MAVARKIEAKALRLVNLMQRIECEHNDPTRFIKDQIDNVFVCLRNGIKQPWNDWKLKVDTSTIPNGGRGVFLDGHAPAGRLLCFYSGELWRSEDVESTIAKLRSDEYAHEHDSVVYELDQLLVGEYTYSRDDGTLIDGSPCDKIHDVFRENPLCLGYCINHPPKGTKPNLLALDVPYLFDSLNRKYQPTWHRLKEVQDEGITVFLAMEDIKNGEELFFDYDLGNDDGKDNEKLPSWYHYIDPSVYDGDL